MNGEIKALIEEAIADLKKGDVDAALLVLERTIRPKFNAPHEARDAYQWDVAERNGWLL